MRLTRFLRPELVKLELETAPPAEVPEGWTADRLLWHVKERVLEELVRLFAASGRIGNLRKFSRDLLHRERKASTALGGGVAIPHVRTLQAKDFVFCFARSTAGVDFGAPDGAPVHFFFGLVAPPHDDRLYLEAYREIARVFTSEEAKARLAAARDEHELIRVLSVFGE